MAAEIKKEIQLEIAHVLFIDIVGYSKLSINDQRAAIDELTQVVRATEQFQNAEAAARLIKIPTGDGMALVFYKSPEEPVECALEISRALKGHPRLQLRMGVHSGPVSGVIDVNGQANLAGAGLNMAQRVMDCGDAGHILLSKRVSDDLGEYEHWRPLLHDLGECEVKHGVRVSIANLHAAEVGNPELPKKFQALKKHRARTRWFTTVAALLALAAIVASIAIFSRNRGRSTLAAPEKSIAVLPFENLSDDKANAYFAEGIQDELLTRLSKIADLKVISRTSTQHYKSAPENLPEIARQLGVANIMEGSVQKSVDAVRVNVQLIKASTDSHLYAETFDKTLTDVFAVESEIAEAIADKLQARLTAPEAEALKVRPTENSAAHDLYLKGLYFWNKRNAADLEKALVSFNEAVARDPNYALAWEGIAEAYTLLPLYGGASPADALPKAKAAANKAIQLDPTLGEPHAVLGNLLTATFEFPASMREFEKAIALNPNDATTHHWFGDSLLECIGDHDRSIAEHKRALELDPLSLAINIDLGYSYYTAGRYSEAIAQVRKALELDPNSYAAHYNLGWVLEASGDLPGAIAEYTKSVSLDSDPFALALLGHAEALNGNRDAALEILKKLTTSTRYTPDYSIGLVYLGLGDQDQAMNWLEKAFAKGQPDLNTIRFDPLLKPLHGNPRFDALAEKIAPARVLASLVTSNKKPN
jgi:TolB-like protein/Tfp pilus assembly protein PilF/class 3 adenylate cyclase